MSSAQMPRVVRLGREEAPRLRALRLRSLADAPGAFGTTLEAALTWATDVWLQQARDLPTFVAGWGESDVGIVRVCREETANTIGLISMWVDPQARGARVGAALINAVLAWARSVSAKRVVLDVALDNAAAISLYRRAGFEPTGKMTRFPAPREHIQECQMALTLE